MKEPSAQEVSKTTNLLSRIEKHLEALSSDDAGIVQLFFDPKLSMSEISQVYDFPPDKIKEVIIHFLVELITDSPMLQRFFPWSCRGCGGAGIDLERQVSLLAESSETPESAGARIRELVGTAIQSNIPPVPFGVLAEVISKAHDITRLYKDHGVESQVRLEKKGTYVGWQRSSGETKVKSVAKIRSDNDSESKPITTMLGSRGSTQTGSMALSTEDEEQGSLEPPISRVQEIAIRVLDIVGALGMLFITMPAMLLAAFLIKIFTPGTVVYKQKRVGKNGRIFTLYKFRTMINNAEEHIGPVLATQDDLRVTPVIGSILRKTRLDELPQLFNVLWGDMSLVGPRPERPYFVKQHKALQGIRLTVKPGLTGLAQVRSFYNLKPDHKLRYDHLYIQKRSLQLNMHILLRTIPVLFTRKGW
jgi:lipopolysaccharide/colanic/teichoic acid biosynthesis glycosyltransferase